jgi:hypothetical protein
MGGTADRIPLSGGPPYVTITVFKMVHARLMWFLCLALFTTFGFFAGQPLQVFRNFPGGCIIHIGAHKPF